ncbi:DUF89 family protein [Candidatus Bipolaricaulota bacterium]|nr:DUF89 family protein [Candidatus Bipolaricaulota bacterium]
MEIKLGCLPCYVNQAMEATRYARMGEDDRWEVVQRVCKELSNIDRSQPSARVGQKVHKIVRDKAKTFDPYRDQKVKSNESARKYLDEFRKKVLNSEDPLERAARLATAGNAVDFGPKRDFDIEKELERGYREGFAINHWQDFLSLLRKAKELLYFVDNSGEIIYDTLFVELLLERSELERLDLVVKDGPFLNDVTEGDLKDLKISELDGVDVKSVDNGDGGSSPTLWSSEVESWLNEYELVVSKGQANYEGLSGYKKGNLFFFLTVKCDLVAVDTGAEEGSKVLINSAKALNRA